MAGTHPGTELGGLLFAGALLVALVVWLFQPREVRWAHDGGRVTRLVSGWRWKGPAPKPFAALRLAFWTYMVTLLLAVATIPLWAQRKADVGHPVPFRMRDGQVFYVQPWVGRAIDLAFPIAGGLLVGLAFVGWRKRSLLERYNHGAG